MHSIVHMSTNENLTGAATPLVNDQGVCPVCGERLHLLAPGFGGLPARPVGRACACVRREWEAERAYQEAAQRKASARRRNAALLDAGLRLEVPRGRTLETWRDIGDPRLREAVEGFLADARYRVAHGAGLLVCGQPRCGKSFALDALDNELAAAGWSCAHQTQGGLLSAWRGTFDRDSRVTEHALLRALEGADVAIVDDLGAGPASSTWGLSKLREIVEALHRARVPIVAASPLPADALRRALGGPGGVADVILERAAVAEVGGAGLSGALHRATEAALGGRRPAGGA